jgi:hypothetical protein
MRIFSTTIVLDSEIMAPIRGRNRIPPEEGLEEQVAEGRRDDHLDGSADQRQPADGSEVAEAELEAEREEEERDSDLRQKLDVMHVADGGAGEVGSDQEPAQDVADEQGLPQTVGEEAPGESGEDDEDEIRSDAHGGGKMVPRGRTEQAPPSRG